MQVKRGWKLSYLSGIVRTGGSMGGSVIHAIVRGMDVSAPGFLLEL